MGFRDLWSRLREWLQDNNGPISEEEDHRLTIERLDKEQPGWDRDSQVCRAEHMLEAGFGREFTVEIYGEEIVREAEANILKNPGRNS